MNGAEFVTELKPLLEARAGLAGVSVYLTEPDPPKAPMIVLIAAPVRHAIDWVAMGPKRTDDGTVPGRVWTSADTMTTAATQAMAILAEIATQVTGPPATPQVGAQTRMASLTEIAWQPMLNDKGGWFVDATYEIAYTADIA